MLERSKFAVELSSGSKAIKIVSPNSRVATQILANLQRFELADREIDNDTVRVEAFGLNACFEATRSGRGAEGPLDGQLALQVLDQDLVLGDDEDFRHRFVFQVTQGAFHAP